MEPSRDIPPLTVILGPTASGKTALSLRLAQAWGAEVLSCDSMQVYRGMDIGTAKPTAAERAIAPHHLIDVAEPTESFTCARFVELADAVIASCLSAKRPLIIVAGTPLYLKALFEGLFEGPAADAGLREELSRLDSTELHKQLAAADPESASRIHANDRKRLIRAVEVFRLTGTPISELQQQWGGKQRYAARWLGLMWETPALSRRINARAKQMLADGWLDEVRRLREIHGSLSGTASEATGYRLMERVLDGRMGIDDALEEVKISTRQLARKQMKWFRRFPGVTWLPGDMPGEELAALAVAGSSQATESQ